MKDEYAFMNGGPMVARGPQTFHVETMDPQATRGYYDNQTNARRSQEEPWRPIGQIRREDLHKLLDEWIDKLGSA